MCTMFCPWELMYTGIRRMSVGTVPLRSGRRRKTGWPSTLQRDAGTLGT